MNINQTRILNRLNMLSQIGLENSGGVTRFAYGDEDVKARAYIIEIMKKAGLFVRIDASGNIIGRKQGRHDNWPAIAKPAMMNPKLKTIIAQSAEEKGYSYMFIPSGAGHDAQHMASLVPSGMVFVPSIGGISHSPKEFTPPSFCGKGANLLLNAVIIADDKFSN